MKLFAGGIVVGIIGMAFTGAAVSLICGAIAAYAAINVMTFVVRVLLTGRIR